MGEAIVDTRPRILDQLAVRAIAAVVVLGVFAGVAYLSFIWIAIGGCLAIAENGYDLTAKAHAWCTGDGDGGSHRTLVVIENFAWLVIPFVLFFLLAQRGVWRRRPGRAIGWTAASPLPAFLFVIVLRTASLQFLLPAG